MTDRLQEIRERYLCLSRILGEQSIESPYYLLAQAITIILDLLHLLAAKTRECEAAEAVLQSELRWIQKPTPDQARELRALRDRWQQVKAEAEKVVSDVGI